MNRRNAQNDPGEKTVYHFAEGRIEEPPAGYVVPVGDRRRLVGYPLAAAFSGSHGTHRPGWAQAPQVVPSVGSA